MCIYYKGKSGLNYTSQEHIFPAAIGGKKMLPKGYVSDEFNHSISKLERELIQKSLLKIQREIQGPGHRGSLSDKKAKKSEIHVIKPRDPEIPFSLGYIKLARSYEIPHINLNVTTGAINLSCDKTDLKDMSEIKSVLNNFKTKCADGEKLRIKLIMDNDLPQDIILFGIQEGIEDHYNAFYAQHDSSIFKYDFDIIQKIVAGVDIEGQVPESRKYQPVSHRTVNFNIDHFRVYGKMAFNYLSLLKGDEFVLRDNFDEVRTWIASGSDLQFACMDNNPNPLARMISLPDDSHMILLFKKDNHLGAKVYTYGGFGIEILLCRNFNEKFSDPEIGFICDWRNRKEYTVSEYFNQLNRQNNIL